ncbi:MAG: hypothetical protein GX998_00425 [Firmicutes bacterium]|nr:hypothetical protein [Bacillota bacterium]
MVRSALVQPGSDDDLRGSRIAIPDPDTAVFNELAKAVTMAVEPWLRRTLNREVLADTSNLRFAKTTVELVEDETPRPMQIWQTELIGDVNEVLLLRAPEPHAQYLVGEEVAGEAETALTSLIAGWTRVWFATVAQLLNWQIETHTSALGRASELPEGVVPWEGRDSVAMFACGWTFADGGVILLEYCMPASMVQRVAQRLSRIEKQQDPGVHRSLREDVVRTYRPERAGRTGYAPVLPVEFVPLEEIAAESEANGIELVQDVLLDVAAELAKTELQIGELLELKLGDIVKLGKMAGEPMELSLNGQYIARGEVLVLDEQLGIRISEIISPADRLERAQG